jgi:hypothetical protein
MKLFLFGFPSLVDGLLGDFTPISLIRRVRNESVARMLDVAPADCDCGRLGDRGDRGEFSNNNFKKTRKLAVI